MCGRLKRNVGNSWRLLLEGGGGRAKGASVRE